MSFGSDVWRELPVHLWSNRDVRSWLTDREMEDLIPYVDSEKHNGMWLVSPSSKDLYFQNIPHVKFRFEYEFAKLKTTVEAYSYSEDLTAFIETYSPVKPMPPPSFEEVCFNERKRKDIATLERKIQLTINKKRLLDREKHLKMELNDLEENIDHFFIAHRVPEGGKNYLKTISERYTEAACDETIVEDIIDVTNLD